MVAMSDDRPRATYADGPVKVICVVDYYLPGFRGGGPVRTIVNMRNLLADDVDIAVFTRDRDLGSGSAYDTVRVDCWTGTEDGPVYYASPAEFSAAGLKRAMAGHRFDLLYLNSFFGFRSSIEPYLRMRRLLPRIPVLLAPRGEFSLGAMAIKPIRKRAFVGLGRALGLYRDIAWHASTPLERDDVLRQFPMAAGRIHLAEDPVDIGIVPDDADQPQPSPPGQLRLAFISRISPMKNLDGLLRALAATTRGIVLDIFGPIEDSSHWRDCQKLIATLPPNVAVSYEGAVNPEGVSAVFARYDLFAFPTHGENFGHVIFEALRAGTPVLVSDQTPWTADPSRSISVLPLAGTAAWSAHLDAAADRGVQEKRELRRAARAYAEDFARDSGIAARNLAMFQAVAAGGRRHRGAGGES
jgi:glycosyltransferase involved in cell wall biosynthesis